MNGYKLESNSARLQSDAMRAAEPVPSGIESKEKTDELPRIDELDLLFLEITSKCNLQCIHCYANSGPELPMTLGMTRDKWRKVLRDASNLGCQRVQFIGGEPTIHPDLLELVAEANGLGYQVIEVYTNGTIMNGRMLECFREFNATLAFSVYAATAEIHDSITKRAGSFEATIENIRQSLEFGIPLRVTIVEMEQNAGEIDATEAMLAELGVQSIKVDRLRGIGRGNITLGVTDPMGEMCGDCGKGQLAIDSAGNVFPCLLSKYYGLGDVSGGLEPILGGEALQLFRTKMRSRYCSTAV